MTKAEDRTWGHELAPSLGDRIDRLQGELRELIGEADTALAAHAKRYIVDVTEHEKLASIARPASATIH